MQPEQSSVDQVLDRFSSARSISDLNESAALLLKGQLLSKTRDDPRLLQGIEHCFEITTPAADQLKGIAIAYRLGEASKPVMRQIRPIARSVLVHQLPPLDLLTDGEDRYYASLSIMDADGPWVSQFAANGIAREETAETARTTLARRLFSNESLADALRLIGNCLAQVTFLTEKPRESAARRLRRVVAAARRAIVLKAIPPGRNVGQALQAIFNAPFAKLGGPPEGELSWELASECCGLVHDILRTQLSLVADPEVYRSLSTAKSWITPPEWVLFVREDPALGHVRSTLEEAVLLLAQRKVTDPALLDALAMFFPTRDEAAKRTRRIAEDNEGLDEDVREWLARFGRHRVTPILSTMTEARDSKSDSAVASLLVLAESLRTLLQNTDRTASADDPRNQVFIMVNRLVDEIVTLASARDLSVRLAPGDIVEYSENAHELIGGRQLGVRNVRVIQPLVERRGSNGVSAVIRKAIVSPVEKEANA
jgi:hypothetical protein